MLAVDMMHYVLVLAVLNALRSCGEGDVSSTRQGLAI